MSVYPTEFDEQTTVVSTNMLGDTAKQALNTLEERGYQVQIGLTEQIVEHLHEISLQPSIKEYCPNDCSTRFADIATTKNWLKKGRVTVLLIEKDTGDVAGYGWFGDGTTAYIPNGKQTFAVRISEKYQGKGLATPYSQIIVDLARNLYGADHLWLEAWASNVGAVHIYEKLGFALVTSEQTTRPTADGGKVADTRLYMQ